MKLFLNSLLLFSALLAICKSGFATGSHKSRKFKTVYLNVDAIDSAGKHFRNGRYLYPAFEKRVLIISEAIKVQDPDILAFSEAAFSEKQLQLLSDSLSPLGFSQKSGVPGKLGFLGGVFSGVSSWVLPSTMVMRNSGLVIFVHKRNKLKSCYENTFSNSSGRDLIVNKGALICKIKLKNSFDGKKTVYVGIAHLQAGSYKGSFFVDEKNARIKQLKEIVSFIKNKIPSLQEQSRLILGGDFNIDFNRFSSRNSGYHVFDSLGLVNLHSKNTHPDSGIYRPPYKTVNGWNAIIDHAFTSLNFYDLLDFDVVKVANGNKLASDHQMLVVSEK